jgi:hypothetical protein
MPRYENLITGQTARLPGTPCEWKKAAAPKSKTRRTGKRRGEMNSLERKFSAYLDLLKLAGEIAEYRYEAIRILISEGKRRSYWTPDFLVKWADGRVEIIEVKGHWWDRDRVRIKVAADRLRGIISVVAVEWRRQEGGWVTESF